MSGKDIGFLTVNLAAYSPRPNTPAAELQDQVPEVPVRMLGGEPDALQSPFKGYVLTGVAPVFFEI